MKSLSVIGYILTASLIVATPTISDAHVGHGDEFQAEGGINRVPVNAQTDSLMGIVVTPIAPAPNGSAAVLIPVTALVDADGKQLTFVQYENFYEPVPVTTGATQGDLIEVTGGLSVGEKLVTQGGLSLYAESRKTQTATAPSSPAAAPATDPAAIASPQPNAHAQADAQGIPHSHDAAGNLVATNGVAEESSGGLMGMLAALGGGAAVIAGAIAVLGNSRKKRGTFSSKKRGF